MNKPVSNFSNASINISRRFANAQRVRNIANAVGTRARVTLGGNAKIMKTGK